MLNRLLGAALLSCAALAAQAQTKTITFDNAATPKTIRLVDGSSVAIATSGNLTAKCVLDGSNNCADVGTGTNVGAPTVALSASYSLAADGNGAYPSGTLVTISATVSGAEICVKTATGPTDSGWPGTLQSGFANPGTAGVYTASSSYSFAMRCYNAAGSTTSNAISVTTAAGGGGGGGTPDHYCDNVPPPSGFGRSAFQSWQQVFGSPFAGYDPTSAAVPHSPFLVYMGASKNQYLSVAFTTPAGIWDGGTNLSWNDSQISGGPPQFSGTAKYYVTISRCPGDFRTDFGTPRDNTERPVCKNLRKNQFTGAFGSPTQQLTIASSLSGADPTTVCTLEPQTTYYLNYINANVTDGISAGEFTCDDPSNCGMQAQFR